MIEGFRIDPGLRLHSRNKWLEGVGVIRDRTEYSGRHYFGFSSLVTGRSISAYVHETNDSVGNHHFGLNFFGESRGKLRPQSRNK